MTAKFLTVVALAVATLVVAGWIGYRATETHHHGCTKYPHTNNCEYNVEPYKGF